MHAVVWDKAEVEMDARMIFGDPAEFCSDGRISRPPRNKQDRCGMRGIEEGPDQTGNVLVRFDLADKCNDRSLRGNS